MVAKSWIPTEYHGWEIDRHGVVRWHGEAYGGVPPSFAEYVHWLEDEVERCEKEFQELGDIDRLRAELQDLEAQVDDLTVERDDLVNEINTTERHMERACEHIHNAADNITRALVMLQDGEQDAAREKLKLALDILSTADDTLRDRIFGGYDGQ